MLKLASTFVRPGCVINYCLMLCRCSRSSSCLLLKGFWLVSIIKGVYNFGIRHFMRLFKLAWQGNKGRNFWMQVTIGSSHWPIYGKLNSSFFYYWIIFHPYTCPGKLLLTHVPVVRMDLTGKGCVRDEWCWF